MSIGLILLIILILLLVGSFPRGPTAAAGATTRAAGSAFCFSS
jgi:hypothetical protein